MSLESILPLVTRRGKIQLQDIVCKVPFPFKIILMQESTEVSPLEQSLAQLEVKDSV